LITAVARIDLGASPKSGDGTRGSSPVTPEQSAELPPELPALPRYAEVGRVKRVITPYREAVL